MKKQSLLLASLLVSGTIVHGQTQSGQSAPSGGGTAGSQSTQSGQAQPSPGVNQNNASQRPIDINQPRDPGPDERILFQNQQQQQQQFGGTNQIQFGATNRPGVATTNPAFGTTNPPFGATSPAFGTNVPPGAFPTNRAQPPVAGRGGLIDEAAGARATNRFGQTNQVGQQNRLGRPGGADDQAFSQQLRAALSRTGATQIFFPHTRSTITVLNQNGTVTLRGYVSSEEERRSIEARIQNTPGITSVNNQLQLATEPPRGIDPTAFPAPGVATNRAVPAPAPAPPSSAPNANPVE